MNLQRNISTTPPIQFETSSLKKGIAIMPHRMPVTLFPYSNSQHLAIFFLSFILSFFSFFLTYTHDVFFF